MHNILYIFSKLSEFEGITITKLEQKIGASKGVLSRAIANNTDIQSKWLLKLVENYPQYNPEWLLTGQGEMLKNEPTIKSYPKPETPEKELPLIPIEVMAGSGSGEFVINEHDVEEYYRIPNFRQADFLVKITGSSMRPKYSNGDIVACKKLVLKDVFFEWNRVYVLDTVQGAIIKRIKKGSKETHVLIVSDNTDYEPFELNISKINAVAIVIGVVRLE